MRREAPFSPDILDRDAKFILAAIAAVWLSALLGGGSARADVLYVLLVRLVAVAGLCFLLLKVPSSRLRLVRAPLLFMGMTALAIAVQLVPLPHDIWTSLPGRAPYTSLDAVPEIGPIWRPISLSPDLTWNSLLALLPPLFFIVATASLHQRQRTWILIALLGTILAGALLGLFQVAGGPTSELRWYPITNVDSATGFFANRNHQAVFLAMGIPLTAWWATRRTEARMTPRLAVAASAILFLFIAIVSTKSRAGLGVGAVALLLSGAYVLRRIRLQPRHLGWLAGTFAVGGLLGAIGLANWSANRLSWAAVQDDLRLRILPESLEAAAAFFPVGSGFGTFPNVFRRFESVEDLSPTYVNHTHSEPTQLAIEGGVVSLLLLLLFVLWYLWATQRVWLAKEGGDRWDQGRLSSILLLLPLLASITDYPIRTPLMACSVAVAAALLHLAARSTAPSAGPP